MHKNKIVLTLALGLMLSPFFAVQAEDSATAPIPTSTGAAVQINNNGEIKNIKADFNSEIKSIQNTAKQEAEKIKQEANVAQKNILDAAKQQKENLTQELQKKVIEIKDTATLTAEQKQAEIKDLRDTKLADLKANIEAKKVEIKANINNKIEALKNNIETRKIEILNKIAEKKTEIKTKLAVKAQENVKATLEKIYNNLNSKIEKLTEVDVKILSKINTAITYGINVDSAKAQYAIARLALDKAITDIAATKTISIDQTSIETSKETLRSLVKTAEDSIKAAGDEYRKVIPLITPVAKVETNTNTVTQ